MPVAPPLSVLSAQVTPSGLECSQSGYTITVSDSDGSVVSHAHRCVFLQSDTALFLGARFSSFLYFDTHVAQPAFIRCFEEFNDLMLGLPTLRTALFPSRKSGCEMTSYA